VRGVAARLPRHSFSLALAAAVLALAAVAHADGRDARVGGAKPQPRFAYRYIYSSRLVARTAQSYGWNLIDVSSKDEVDALPYGTRGLVWVGDWNNATCSWEISDARLTSKVVSMVGDRKVVGFYFSDEPDPIACPGAPRRHGQRSALIRRLDPAAFTVMVVRSNTATSASEVKLWGGAATYVGLDPYPCEKGEACDFTRMTRMIQAADSAHIAYWGVQQAFADYHWRWPTAAELTRIGAIWKASNATGSMTFAWKWKNSRLAPHPALLAVLRRFNRSG
jgi:hypothetical protein